MEIRYNQRRLRVARLRAGVLSPICFTLTMAALSSYAMAAQTAQWTPTKPVEFITSTAAGGSHDRIVRFMQSIIQSKKLVPVPIVIVNKGGGRGTISVAYLNRYSADGHFLNLVGAGMVSANIMGLVDVHYTDMTVVAQLYHEYPIAVVGKSSPIKNGKDLIARLKKSPSSVSIGLVSPGAAQHISVARAAKAAGVDPRRLKIIVFKSGGEVLVAAMGGHIDVGVSSVSTFRSAIADGTVRAIAVAAPKRLAGDMAEVPTWKELGFDSIVSNFRAMFGPRGLSDAQVAYWEEVLFQVASSEEWLDELEKNSIVGEFLKSQQARQALASWYDSMKASLAELKMAKGVK